MGLGLIITPNPVSRVYVGSKGGIGGTGCGLRMRTLPSVVNINERMKRRIHFSRFTRFEHMERGLGRYGFRKRRPRGGSSKAYGRGGRRGRTGLRPRNMFINQLGGWSANKAPRNRAQTIEITSQHHTHTISMLAGRHVGSEAIIFRPGTDVLFPQTVFPKYQKWKLKKLEFFFKILNTDDSDGSIGQLSIAKWVDQNVPENIMNVPGCQTKMITIHSGSSTGQSTIDPELDILRCACFWPPVSIDGNNSAGSGTATAYLMNPAFDGRQYNNTRFNSFAVQYTLGSPASSSFEVSGIGYFKATFLAYGQSFELS